MHSCLVPHVLFSVSHKLRMVFHAFLKIQKYLDENDIAIDDYHWRTFSLFSISQMYRCITAERIDVRNDLITKISNNIFYMFIVLVPALSLILYLTIDQGLMPL